MRRRGAKGEERMPLLRVREKLWTALVVVAFLASLLAFSALTPNALAQAPAWDGNFHPYAVGDLVSFNGSTYQCVQAHTSQPDWTPTAVPALWKLTTSGGP